MSTSPAPITAEELTRMSDVGRCELIRGELRKMNPAGSEHGILIVRLTRSLANHVLQHDLGFVFGVETGFMIESNPDTVRAPDIAFIDRTHVPADGIPMSFWPGAPDLAVEVLSPSDSVSQVDDKVEAWLNAGAALVWVVNPKWRNVTVYRSASEIVTLNEDDTLSGNDVVPNFSCSVSEIFLPR